MHDDRCRGAFGPPLLFGMSYLLLLLLRVPVQGEEDVAPADQRAADVLSAREIPAVDLPGARGTEAEVGDAGPSERIAELIRSLDADAFSERERATRELDALGEPALATLEEVLAGQPSAEVRRRAERLRDAIELAVIAKNPVELTAILQLGRAPADEGAAARAERHRLLEGSLGRLLKVVEKASGRRHELPVRFADVEPGNPGTAVRGQLVRVGADQQVASAKDSILFLEEAGTISHVENCIVVAAYGAHISFCKNSIVLARYDLQIAHPERSVVLCGHQARLSIVQDCVCGAHESLTISSSKQVTVLNSQIDVRRLQNGSQLKTTPGLVLDPKLVNALEDRLTITAAVTAQGGIVLFRHNGAGEYVARVGEPITDTEGKPLAALAGWRLRYVSNQLAVFEKGGEHAVYEVTDVR